MESVALAGNGPAKRNRCWAAQVASFLDFMQPIVDGVAQFMDPDVVGAVLQRRYFESVNCSDKTKVQSWLRTRGPADSVR